MNSAPATPPRRPSLGAGMVCFRGDQVLLIKRGKAPRLGEWSIPGGHVEWGETTAEAAMREVMEETGIEAEALDLIEVIDAIGPGDPPQERAKILVAAADSEIVRFGGDHFAAILREVKGESPRHGDK